MLEQSRQALEQQPMEDASPYWHAEKYLYLICRTRDGYRPRRYIGNNPEKVAQATAAIANFKEHKRITEEMRDLQNQLAEAQFALQSFIGKLQR